MWQQALKNSEHLKRLGCKLSLPIRLLGLEKAKRDFGQVLDQAQNLLKEIAQNRPFSGESLTKIIESLRLYD